MGVKSTHGIAMAVAASCRHASSIFRSSRSRSCPDISRTIKPTATSIQPRRQINMMILNPRASKIRYLNASHSLLIDLEKHVRKVQELERQLQLREMMKTGVAGTAVEQEQRELKRIERESMSEEARENFANRLTAARKKCEEQAAKRDQEEANILRSWHMKRLGSAIDKLSQIPETELMLLPGDSPVTEKDLAAHPAMLASLEGLVDMVNPTDEVERLKSLLEERDNLRKLIEELEGKEGHINGTLEECKNALHNVNAARIKVSANLKMCETLLDTMQNLEQKRRKQDLFVFGPNPIFSSTKEVELSYSISNQCVVEMLKELDISRAVALKNLQSARECRSKHIENRTQIEENLQLIQRTIEKQIEAVNKKEEKQAAHKEGKVQETEVAETPKIFQDLSKEMGKEM